MITLSTTQKDVISSFMILPLSICVYSFFKLRKTYNEYINYLNQHNKEIIKKYKLMNKVLPLNMNMSAEFVIGTFFRSKFDDKTIIEYKNKIKLYACSFIVTFVVFVYLGKIAITP